MGWKILKQLDLLVHILSLELQRISSSVNQASSDRQLQSCFTSKEKQYLCSKIVRPLLSALKMHFVLINVLSQKKTGCEKQKILI